MRFPRRVPVPTAIPGARTTRGRGSPTPFRRDTVGDEELNTGGPPGENRRHRRVPWRPPEGARLARFERSLRRETSGAGPESFHYAWFLDQRRRRNGVEWRVLGIFRLEVSALTQRNLEFCRPGWTGFVIAVFRARGATPPSSPPAPWTDPDRPARHEAGGVRNALGISIRVAALQASTSSCRL